MTENEKSPDYTMEVSGEHSLLFLWGEAQKSGFFCTQIHRRPQDYKLCFIMAHVTDRKNPEPLRMFREQLGRHAEFHILREGVPYGGNE